MRKSLIPFIVLASLGTATAALALDATGTIKSIDQTNMTITLSDGTVYHFADTKTMQDQLSGVKPNDHVKLTWDMVGQDRQIEALDAVQG